VRFAWGCRWPCSLVSCILPPHSRCHRLLEIFSLGLELGVLACAWRDRGGGERGLLTSYCVPRCTGLLARLPLPVVTASTSSFVPTLSFLLCLLLLFLGSGSFAVCLGMCAAKLPIWQLGLLSWRYGNLAFRRSWQCPGGTEGAPTYQICIRTQKKAERNSHWHHQTPLLTEKRFQAANRSWTKRQLQAVVTFFTGRFVQNPSCSCCSP
jgi:hypothetical protein